MGAANFQRSNSRSDRFALRRFGSRITLAGLTEQANLVSVWKSLRTTADVEEKAQAERIQMALPPSIQTKDVKVLTKLFEKSTEGYEVTNSRRCDTIGLATFEGHFVT